MQARWAGGGRGDQVGPGLEGPCPRDRIGSEEAKGQDGVLLVRKRKVSKAGESGSSGCGQSLKDLGQNWRAGHIPNLRRLAGVSFIESGLGGTY